MSASLCLPVLSASGTLFGEGFPVVGMCDGSELSRSGIPRGRIHLCGPLVVSDMRFDIRALVDGNHWHAVDGSAACIEPRLLGEHVVMPMHNHEMALFQRIATCERCAARSMTAVSGSRCGVLVLHRHHLVGRWQYYERGEFRFYPTGLPDPTHSARDVAEAHAMTVGMAALNDWW